MPLRLTPDIKSRIFGAYVVVLTLGAALAASVFLAGAEMQQVSDRLITRDLPQLQTIAQLKLGVTAQEIQLLHYYFNRDRSRFIREYTRIEDNWARGLERLASNPNDRVNYRTLDADYQRLITLGRELGDVLAAPEVDEPRARQIVAQASAVSEQARERLDDVAMLVETHVQKAGAYSLATVKSMQWRVMLIAGAIFIVSLAVGYYINAYINEQTERRRLAMFPERNPNPVLRLSPAGEVVYANPASAALMRRVGVGEARALLPDDLERRLTDLKRGAGTSEIWEYALAGTHALECGIHWFADLEVFHVYVVDVTERRRAQERLVHQTYHDALTGLPNRRLFEERLGYTLSVAAGGDMQAALLLLGLDRTRVLIAGFGHTAGDTLLRLLARRLQAVLAEDRGAGGTSLYRFDGDRFLVLAPGIVDPQAPEQLAERILAAIAAPFEVQGHEHHASVSIGISIAPADGRDAFTLLRNAESALHLAKQSGGARFRRYTLDMNRGAAENLVLENELRHAEARGELRLFYQPQVDMATGAIVGIEALIRWQHSRMGLVLPGAFLPQAEDTGLIVPLGDWVLRTACAQCAAWRAQGHNELVVAVNVSARQFSQPELSRKVKDILAESGLASGGLELELTESVAMYDVARTASTLWELRHIGARLSVDDFGTGFSSLNYLKRFPLDKLKVDQSFVSNLATDENDAAITRAVIDLGHVLRLRVIAEGVETAEQLARLREFGCDEYQGYLFAKPMPADRLTEMLATTAPGIARKVQKRSG